jgi:putative molybdopterin biosynthesis protein
MSELFYHAAALLVILICMAKQEQFLDVVDRDVAERRFREALGPIETKSESIDLTSALGRVLAEDILAPINVPGFDRSNFDGFAVAAEDTYSADEQNPVTLHGSLDSAPAGRAPTEAVSRGNAMPIATGGMVPRGATAVIPIEHVDVGPFGDGPAVGDEALLPNDILIRRAVTEGFGIAFAGSDMAKGETVLRRGTLLSSRETGVLAAIGVAELSVIARPRVAIISTGDEVVEPGKPLIPGQIYDSNGQILADAVRELGGEPVRMGIVNDDFQDLEERVEAGLASCDVVLLSGGTSKGEGDLCYRVVSQFDDPGIVVHGVALKPGKPICLAVTRGKPVVVLPGFPTSAIFTFHEFVGPIVRKMAGGKDQRRAEQEARTAVRINSVVGRKEYVLVGLIRNEGGLPTAFPLGKGSGSVTTFSTADGFIAIDRHEEMVESGRQVSVQLLSRDVPVADLVVIGSHCMGVDFLLGQLQSRGFNAKSLVVGSTAGLNAVGAGQADLAGIHLLDPQTGSYNESFLPPGVALLRGYRRRQGILFRSNDERFQGLSTAEVVELAKQDPGVLMVNRNVGSGTRILIDQHLQGARPTGYGMQSRSHHAVAQAIRQNRADWGVAIENVAAPADLEFLALADEHFDFAVPESKLESAPILAFRQILSEAATAQQLVELGFYLDEFKQ